MPAPDVKYVYPGVLLCLAYCSENKVRTEAGNGSVLCTDNFSNRKEAEWPF
jgi:hypothetical protein